MSDGSTNGNTNGTRIAASRLDAKVYVVSEAALPPNFPVITAAAVAVGQMRQTIAPSNAICPHSWKGKRSKMPATSRQDTDWMSKRMYVQRLGESSFISTLQKVSSNWAKISDGVSQAMKALTKGFIGWSISNQVKQK